MSDCAQSATLRATIAAMREVIAHLNNQIRTINRAIEKHHMVK